MKKILCMLLALALLLSGAALAQETETEQKVDLSGHLVILHTGMLSGDPNSGLGLAKVALVKKRMEDAGASVLVIDAGGSLFGGADTLPDGGAALARLMGEAGYSVLSLSEADLVLPGAAELLSHAQGVPQMLYPGHEEAKLARQGFKTGLFRLGGEDGPEQAAAHVKALDRSNCDLIIAVSDLPLEEAEAIADGTEGIDLILLTGGEVLVEGEWRENDTLIARAGEGLSTLGCVLVNPEGKSVALSIDETFFEEGTQDDSLEEAIAAFAEAREAAASLPLTTLEAPVEGADAMAQWLYDLLCTEGGAQAMILSRELFAADLLAGEVSLSTLRGALADGAQLYQVRVTGEALTAALSDETTVIVGVEKVKGEDGLEFWSVGDAPVSADAQFTVLTDRAPQEGEYQALGALEKALTLALLSRSAEDLVK